MQKFELFGFCSHALFIHIEKKSATDLLLMFKWCIEIPTRIIQVSVQWKDVYRPYTTILVLTGTVLCAHLKHRRKENSRIVEMKC